MPGNAGIRSSVAESFAGEFVAGDGDDDGDGVGWKGRNYRGCGGAGGALALRHATFGVGAVARDHGA